MTLSFEIVRIQKETVFALHTNTMCFFENDERFPSSLVDGRRKYVKKSVFLNENILTDTDEKRCNRETAKTNTFMFSAQGPVSRRYGPEKFSHPESDSKISKLMITELFYSRIININRGSLHKRNFRRIHFSVFRYR